MNEKKADPFYRSEAWLRLREVALQRDKGLCVECMRLYELGLIKKVHRAKLVHHIEPYKDAPERALDLNNLESLCPMHHEQKHPERRSRKAEEETPRMRIIKV